MKTPDSMEWVTTENLHAFVEALVARFRPEKIILFGSRAEGTARPDSDVDLLVVMDFEGHRAETAARLYCVGPSLPVDLVLRRPADLRRRLEWGDPFLKEIIEKGKVLYERAA